MRVGVTEYKSSHLLLLQPQGTGRPREQEPNQQLKRHLLPPRGCTADEPQQEPKLGIKLTHSDTACGHRNW